MSFLPENYKEPVISNYMEFEDGDNTFRVLDSAVMGWEYWTDMIVDGEKKSRPVRVKEYDAIPLGEVNVNKFGNLNLSFFWAFPVYNFDAQRIQILVVKQKTVRTPMQKNIKNPKWGDPRDYNFVVSKDQDEKGKIFYTVTTEPKEPLDKAIIQKYKSMSIDMNAWMAGKDPFKPSNEVKESEESYNEADEVASDVPF